MNTLNPSQIFFNEICQQIENAIPGTPLYEKLKSNNFDGVLVKYTNLGGGNILDEILYPQIGFTYRDICYSTSYFEHVYKITNPAFNGKEICIRHNRYLITPSIGFTIYIRDVTSFMDRFVNIFYY